MQKGPSAYHVEFDNGEVYFQVLTPKTQPQTGVLKRTAMWDALLKRASALKKEHAQKVAGMPAARPVPAVAKPAGEGEQANKRQATAPQAGKPDIVMEAKGLGRAPALSLLGVLAVGLCVMMVGKGWTFSPHSLQRKPTRKRGSGDRT